MGRRQYFATKSLDVLLAEMAGEHRLKRVLGPVSLSALGIGATIGTKTRHTFLLCNVDLQTT